MIEADMRRRTKRVARNVKRYSVVDVDGGWLLPVLVFVG
jgi:hypothetical protein